MCLNYANKGQIIRVQFHRTQVLARKEGYQALNGIHAFWLWTKKLHRYALRDHGIQDGTHQLIKTLHNTEM